MPPRTTARGPSDQSTDHPQRAPRNQRHEHLHHLRARVSQVRDDLPAFRCGDTVKVHYRVVEGEKTRIQVFQGIVIKRHRAGVRSTFTVRKVSFGTGVEPSLHGLLSPISAALDRPR